MWIIKYNLLLLIGVCFFCFSCTDKTEKTNATQYSKKNDGAEILNKIKFSIEKKDRFSSIENRNVKPNDGDIFLAFLVAISNQTSMNLYGGGCDYHSSFKLLTEDGYTISAENTASEAWRQNRQVWCNDEIPPDETRRGWIVFSLSETKKIKSITFDVCEITGPSKLRAIGKQKISLDDLDHSR